VQSGDDSLYCPVFERCYCAADDEIPNKQEFSWVEPSVALAPSRAQGQLYALARSLRFTTKSARTCAAGSRVAFDNRKRRGALNKEKETREQLNR
jgi:hypothetical protein